jgi:hypothetical protein
MAEQKQEKVVPPTPPLTIKDKDRGVKYDRIGFLGEVSNPSTSQTLSLFSDILWITIETMWKDEEQWHAGKQANMDEP